MCNIFCQGDKIYFLFFSFIFISIFSLFIYYLCSHLDLWPIINRIISNDFHLVDFIECFVCSWCRLYWEWNKGSFSIVFIGKGNLLIRVVDFYYHVIIIICRTVVAKLKNDSGSHFNVFIFFLFSQTKTVIIKKNGFYACCKTSNKTNLVKKEFLIRQNLTPMKQPSTGNNEKPIHFHFIIIIPHW